MGFLPNYYWTIVEQIAYHLNSVQFGIRGRSGSGRMERSNIPLDQEASQRTIESVIRVNY